MYQNLEVRRLTSACLWIVIMQGTSVSQFEKWFLDTCEHHICAVVLKETVTSETSVFGAGFVTMKQGIYALRGLRYMLRMMGILTSGPT